MTSSYPTSLQDLDATRGASGDKLSSPNHVTHHALEDSTLEAVQTKLGIDSSTDHTSIDWLLKNSASVNPGHMHSIAAAMTDVVISSPSDGQLLTYDAASGKWKNAGTSAADASTTVKGVTKLSVAPVSSSNPVAVGDNDPRFITTSGSTLNGTTNKVVDQADVSAAAASGKIVRATGTSLPALDGSNLTGLKIVYATGLATDLSTTSAANNDETITLTFLPRLIKLNYFIQGHTGAGNTNVYTGRKGVAVYNGAILVMDIPQWNSQKLSGDDGSINDTSVGSAFINSVTSTSAPATFNDGFTGQIVVTLTITSVTSTGFTIRKATTLPSGGTASGTARCRISYEAFA